MLISELQTAFNIQHIIWFHEYVQLFWILWRMDFKTSSMEIHNMGTHLGFKTMSWPSMIDEESFGRLNRGKKEIKFM